MLTYIFHNVPFLFLALFTQKQDRKWPSINLEALFYFSNNTILFLFLDMILWTFIVFGIQPKVKFFTNSPNAPLRPAMPEV